MKSSASRLLAASGSLFAVNGSPKVRDGVTGTPEILYTIGIEKVMNEKTTCELLGDPLASGGTNSLACCEHFLFCETGLLVYGGVWKV